MELSKFGRPSTRVGGPRQQNHHAMNVRILSNPHTRQNRNEKKVLDRVKKKAKLEWDELQAQAQQMEQVKWLLLVRLASEILLGIIGIPTWGVGFIPQSSWAHLEKDKNLVETIWASRIAYAKPLKLAWGTRNWTLEFNKRNRVKEMDAISKYHDSKIIQRRYISILFLFFLNIVCILTLECNLFILFSCVRFRSTTKEAFVANAIRLALEHCQLFTHHHAAKAVKVVANYRTNMGIPSSSSSSKE
jgi:hypothetical protein